MNEQLTRQDVERLFRDLMASQWNQLMTQDVNNIRVGTIQDFNWDTRRASVKLLNTGEILSNVQYPKGASYEIINGNTAMISSADPKVKSQNYIVGIY